MNCELEGNSKKSPARLKLDGVRLTEGFILLGGVHTVSFSWVDIFFISSVFYHAIAVSNWLTFFLTLFFFQ